MFFNAQNPMFPFQMPNMNGQFPFQFPFQMPNMNGQFPFPNPFQMGANNTKAAAECEEGQTAQQFNPFTFFQQQMSQMPFPFPFQMGAKKTEGEETAAEGSEAQADARQPSNPFEFFQQMFQIQQFTDMFKNMFSMFGMNPQNCGCQQGVNPFGCFQMPNMNEQMQQMKQQFQQFEEMLKNKISSLGIKGGNQANGLPFGMPVKLLQLLLHMDSTPDGLSKFQKILDMIFDEYSKARTPAEE